jgi:phthalate 4,5-dioxygenase oxygenase subunit
MSFEGMVPKGDDWRLLNVSDEERRLSSAAEDKGDLVEDLAG